MIAHWIAQRPVPAWLRGLMPVLIIPLGATLAAGLVMLVVLAKPLASLMTALNDGLQNMASGGAGKPEHLADAILLGGADAALAASIFHYGEYTIHETKELMRARGIPVRL